MFQVKTDCVLKLAADGDNANSLVPQATNLWFHRVSHALVLARGQRRI